MQDSHWQTVDAGSGRKARPNQQKDSEWIGKSEVSCLIITVRAQSLTLFSPLTTLSPLALLSDMLLHSLAPC